MWAVFGLRSPADQVTREQAAVKDGGGRGGGWLWTETSTAAAVLSADFLNLYVN